MGRYSTQRESRTKGVGTKGVGGQRELGDKGSQFHIWTAKPFYLFDHWCTHCHDTKCEWRCSDVLVAPGSPASPVFVRVLNNAGMASPNDRSHTPVWETRAAPCCPPLHCAPGAGRVFGRRPRTRRRPRGHVPVTTCAHVSQCRLIACAHGPLPVVTAVLRPATCFTHRHHHHHLHHHYYHHCQHRRHHHHLWRHTRTHALTHPPAPPHTCTRH